MFSLLLLINLFIASSGRFSVISVFITPGATALTRTPDEASSEDKVFVAATIAAFDAEYASCPGFPSSAEMLDIFITDTSAKKN